MSTGIKEELESNSTSSTGTSPQKDSYSVLDNVSNMRIWRKLDVHLLPPIALLYLSCFL